MKELLNSKKFRPPSPVKDAANLSALAGMMNKFAGVVAPKENLPVATEAVKVAPIVQEPTQRLPAAPQAPAASAPVANLNRIFLTGRFRVGKDYVAGQAGCKIHALADPLYFLVDYFFGKQDKEASRIFLQTIGQWGRGTVSATYPLTPERAMFVKMIRSVLSLEGSQDLKVDWQSYGRSENIWLDALVERTKAEPAGIRIAVSGVRFQNEYARLTDEGFIGFHCMTSPTTWAARLKQVGLTPESPAAKDVSEYLAASLDASVTKTLSQHPQGNKLRCIWSDGEVLPPSRRLLTVREFCAMFPK